MTIDHEDLIAEARAHIDALAAAHPGRMADRVRMGECDDPRVALIVRMARALEDAAAHDAEVAAKALEDAAEAWQVETTGTRPITSNWLRARAAALRASTGGENK